jgi:large subunit ribosomal protein L21e
MGKKKPMRKRGKLSFSRYFQEFKEGDRVSVDKELSVNSNFPKRIQGRTGKVVGKRGQAYIVDIKDQDKEKRFLIKPIHLKKIKKIQK